MPRVTRAALRSNAMLEEANIASSTPLPLTPLLERAPLGEIAGNAIEVVDASSSYNKVKKGEKKGSSKTKKGRVKAKKAEPPVMNENTIDVLEDDNQSTTSSAADEARQELLKESSGGTHRTIYSAEPYRLT